MITHALAAYPTSRDYAELWRRAQRESLLCIVDWQECRDVAQTIVTFIDEPELLSLQVSGRGTCYLHAESPEELAANAARINLEWIVPPSDEKKSLTGKESVDRLRRRRRHDDPAGTDGSARGRDPLATLRAAGAVHRDREGSRPACMASRAKICGQDVTLICDGLCSKAWGIHFRPRIKLSGDEDNIVWLADDELPDAPVDPGTYEGNDAKPRSRDEAHNRWCWRECERSSTSMPGEPLVKLRDDWSERVYNIAASDPANRAAEIANEDALEKRAEESSAAEHWLWIGERLRSRRKAAGLTMRDLADMVGSTVPAVSAVELGAGGSVRPDLPDKMRHALDYAEDETADGLDFDEWLTRQEDAQRREKAP